MPYKDVNERKEHDRQYYHKHGERIRKRQRKYDKRKYYHLKENNPEEYQKLLAYYRENNRRRARQIKREVIAHYSNGTMACANPFGEHKEPYTNILALSIDHIHGNGNKFRTEKTKSCYGNTYYWWLKKHGFPEGLQVLCMNCQWIKRHKNHEFNKQLKAPTEEEKEKFTVKV